jgi:hypothetical protein
MTFLTPLSMTSMARSNHEAELGELLEGRASVQWVFDYTNAPLSPKLDNTNDEGKGMTCWNKDRGAAEVPLNQLVNPGELRYRQGNIGMRSSSLKAIHKMFW